MFNFSLETKEVKFLNLCKNFIVSCKIRERKKKVKFLNLCIKLLSIVSCKIRERKKVKFLNLCIELLKETKGLPILSLGKCKVNR